MLSNLQRKMMQKNIKKYSEFINAWWDTEIGLGIFKHYNSSKQRYSKEKMKASFENPNLAQGKIPYYKVNDEIYNMIPCPSGSFIKGSDRKVDKNPKGKMKIEKPFLLGETEITQELHESVMGVNPSGFKQDPKNPVENVSWYDALIFCNKLSDMFKLDRYYTIFKDGRLIDTIEKKQENYVVTMNEDSKGFRLPTEWEWEYAAKAGTQLKYSGSNKANEVAWYEGNSNNTTHPIKQLKPNAWGFYDMSGNVWEWCENGSSETSTYRATRGGSWKLVASPFCSVLQFYTPPSGRYGTQGFRVCRYI